MRHQRSIVIDKHTDAEKLSLLFVVNGLDLDLENIKETNVGEENHKVEVNFSGNATDIMNFYKLYVSPITQQGIDE